MTAAERAAEIRAAAWILQAARRGAPPQPAKTWTGRPQETAREGVPVRRFYQ